MNHNSPQNLQEMFQQQTAYLHKNWAWFFILGLLVTLCGVFAVVHLLLSSVASIFLLSVALFAGGVFIIMSAIQVRRIRKVFWNWLLSGVLFLLACWFILAKPDIALIAITVMAALFLGASGVVRMVAGVMAMGLPGSVWMVISGVIAIIAAILIAMDLRVWSLYLPGLLLGVDILFNGISMMLFAWSVKK